MIVVRFRVTAKPEHADALAAAFREVIVESRPIGGVVSFDVASDLLDANSFVATEVFDNRAALDSQEALPSVKTTIELMETALAGPPEATIFHVTSSEPWG